MNVYVMTDMEGISGINRQEQCRSNTDEWRRSLPLLEAEFNAAIAGAVTGGARRVVLCDAHSCGDNLRLSEMDARAEYERPLGGGNMMPALLHASFDVGFHIGAHAMSGTQDAFLDHTQSSVDWHNYWVNGQKWGELAQFAAYMGHFEVPLVLVSGDDAACIEARELLGEALETVAVKTALGRRHARCIPPELARERIQEAAARALKLKNKAKPFKVKLPAEVTIEFNSTSMADRVAAAPGVERVNARTVRKTAQSARELVGW